MYIDEAVIDLGLNFENIGDLLDDITFDPEGTQDCTEVQ